MYQNNFSIIIPAHNRPMHLKRLLEYYLHQNVKVIVADSSVNKFSQLEEYKGRVIYHHYPQSSLPEKLCNVFPFIDTDYVVMCADDDFIIPKTINIITEFLDKNLDYNSGQGIFVDFDLSEESVRPSLRYPNMLHEQINDIYGCERVLHLMKSYFQFYYAVFRTATFRNIYSSVINENKVGILNLCLLESYVSSYSAIEGKHIIMPILYAARENIVSSAASFTDNIPNVISEKKYRDEYALYIKLLTNLLITSDHLSPELAKQTIINSVDMYMSKNFPYYFTRSARFKRFLKNIAKQIGVENIQKIVLKENRSEDKKNNDLSQSISGYEEWNHIEEYIHLFYKECYPYMFMCNKNLKKN